MVGMTDASGHSEIFYFFHEYNPRPIETEWDLAEWTSQNCDTADKLAFAELSGESAKACSLFELQQWHCRWPIGDPIPEDFGFCGNRPVAGLPYCPAHAQKVRAARLGPAGSTRTVKSLLKSQRRSGAAATLDASES